jgi:hypothetical protein
MAKKLSAPPLEPPLQSKAKAKAKPAPVPKPAAKSGRAKGKGKSKSKAAALCFFFQCSCVRGRHPCCRLFVVELFGVFVCLFSLIALLCVHACAWLFHLCVLCLFMGVSSLCL